MYFKVRFAAVKKTQFLAGLRSNSGLWNDVIRQSVVNILVNLFAI